MVNLFIAGRGKSNGNNNCFGSSLGYLAIWDQRVPFFVLLNWISSLSKFSNTPQCLYFNFNYLFYGVEVNTWSGTHIYTYKLY